MLDTTNDDNEYWEFFDQSVPIVEEEEDEPEDILDQVKQRHDSKIAIVSGFPLVIPEYCLPIPRKRSSA